MSVLTAIFAAAFALIHLSIGRVHFARVVPRSQWFSAAGGVAVAYVFLHILPELSALEGTLGPGIDRRSAEAMVYLASLAGLVSFYGLERAAKASREQSRSRSLLHRDVAPFPDDRFQPA